MEKKLIKIILKKKYYNKYKNLIDKDLFEDELKQIYNIIKYAHEHYEGDLTTNDIEALFTKVLPAATEANKFNLKVILNDIYNEELVKEEIIIDIFIELNKQNLARKLADKAINLSLGQQISVIELEETLTKLKNYTLNDTQEEEYVTTNLDELIKLSADNCKFKFNIPSLYDIVPGIGPGNLVIAFARPEIGKTALWVSLTAGPNGFCQQGAKVHGLINEEPAHRTMMRCVSACTGMNLEQIKEDTKTASKLFNSIKENLKLRDCVGVSIDKIESYTSKYKPDILIIDQLDKIRIEGSYARGDERLKDLYVHAREICKANNCAIIAISQASAEAEGKAILTLDMLENSRTGKAGEADLIIGVGKNSLELDNKFRVISLPKNKLTGNHSHVYTMLNNTLSRYVVS